MPARTARGVGDERLGRPHVDNVREQHYQRTPALPQVPTTLEAGYANSDYTFWTGMFLPARTPREIVERLHQETTKALRAPGVPEKLAQQGIDPMPIAPAAFDAQIKSEIDSILALVKAAGIKFG